MLVCGLGGAADVAFGVGDFDPTEPRWLLVIRSLEQIDRPILEGATFQLRFRLTSPLWFQNGKPSRPSPAPVV
jgi:hypothetical protein